jgi:PAS domain-containing protein
MANGFMENDFLFIFGDVHSPVLSFITLKIISISLLIIAIILFIGIQYQRVLQRKQFNASVESEGKYKTLFERTTDAILVTSSKTGRIIDANQKAQELTGRSLAELHCMQLDELLPVEDIERARKYYTASLQTKKYINEFDIIHRSGK